MGSQEGGRGGTQAKGTPSAALGGSPLCFSVFFPSLPLRLPPPPLSFSPLLLWFLSLTIFVSVCFSFCLSRLVIFLPCAVSVSLCLPISAAPSVSACVVPPGAQRRRSPGGRSPGRGGRRGAARGLGGASSRGVGLARGVGSGSGPPEPLRAGACWAQCLGGGRAPLPPVSATICRHLTAFHLRGDRN